MNNFKNKLLVVLTLSMSMAIVARYEDENRDNRRHGGLFGFVGDVTVGAVDTAGDVAVGTTDTVTGRRYRNDQDNRKNNRASRRADKKSNTRKNRVNSDK